jgi:hypothetical protein
MDKFSSKNGDDLSGSVRISAKAIDGKF